MDWQLLSFILAGFLAVMLLLEGSFLLWNSYRGAEALRIQSRLRVLSAGGALSLDAQIVKRELGERVPAFYRLMLGEPRLQQLDRVVLQSGLKRTLPGLFALCGGAALCGLFLWILLPVSWWAAPLLVLGLGALPLAQVLYARTRRLRAIEEQLPDALDLMGRALRAGHAFPSAVQMVGEEGAQPIAGEFRLTFDEINYGVPVQDALSNLAARVPVTDLRFFVIAVAIQRETGGNLTELLDKLAQLVRGRMKLIALVRVLSTEGRLSAWILTILPFALTGVINLINPKFMSLLWIDPAGRYALAFSLTLMVCGIVWMWRIIKIRI